MVEEKNKIIGVMVIILVTIALLIWLVMADIPFLGTSSIKTVIEQHDEIANKEAELLAKQNEYKSLNTNLDNLKKSFQTEKSKYEAISEDTIHIIRESNTEENYSLEYMWIKLGNYATKHNLTLIMVEPGNSGTLNKEGEQTNSSSNENSVVEKEGNQNSGSSEYLQIQVTGNYIDLSDFVFEVENDEELNFKLDNILMEYVSGTTIKTTFDVKNIIIHK